MSSVVHYCTRIIEMKDLGMRISKYPNATAQLLCSHTRQMKSNSIRRLKGVRGEKNKSKYRHVSN